MNIFELPINREWITEANIGGKIVRYDFCSQKRNKQYDSKLFKYIGKGFIWSINGVRQSFTEKDVYYFWVKK